MEWIPDTNEGVEVSVVFKWYTRTEEIEVIKFRVEPEDDDDDIVVNASLVVRGNRDLELVLTPQGGEPVHVLGIDSSGEFYRMPLSLQQAGSIGVQLNKHRYIRGACDDQPY